MNLPTKLTYEVSAIKAEHMFRAWCEQPNDITMSFRQKNDGMVFVSMQAPHLSPMFSKLILMTV